MVTRQGWLSGLAPARLLLCSAPGCRETDVLAASVRGLLELSFPAHDADRARMRERIVGAEWCVACTGFSIERLGTAHNCHHFVPSGIKRALVQTLYDFKNGSGVSN